MKKVLKLKIGIDFCLRLSDITTRTKNQTAEGIMERIALKVTSYFPPSVVRVRKTDRVAINDPVWEVVEVLAESGDHPFAPNLLEHDELFGERLGIADSGLGNFLREIKDVDTVLRLIEDGNRRWEKYAAALPKEVEIRCWECGRVLGTKQIDPERLLWVWRNYGISLEEQLAPTGYCGC